MEQIIFYLTEYAEVIPVAVGGLAAMLLLVTLHRIKRIEKYIREATGNTRAARREKRRQKKQRGQAQLIAEKNTTAGQMELEGGIAAAANVSAETDMGSAGNSASVKAQADMGHALDRTAPENPTDIIDAVLEEVFL